MEDCAITKLIKYAGIINVLEQNNIVYNGLVDGLVETYHLDNPTYKLHQNPAWWVTASKEDIIDSIISTFNKTK